MSEENKQILMEDPEDEVLKAIMGARFRDMTGAIIDHDLGREPGVPGWDGGTETEGKGNPPVSFADSPLYTKGPLGAAEDQKERRERTEIREQVVPVYAPHWYDRLKGCAKYALVCGLLIALFWYWNISGQMATTAAVPCMVVCGSFGGFRIGKVCREG